MIELYDYQHRFEQISQRLEGNISIMEKIGLLWQQRQILKDWKQAIERIKRKMGN